MNHRVYTTTGGITQRFHAGNVTPVSYTHLEFDQIITDDGLPESASRALAKLDLSWLVAKNE